MRLGGGKRLNIKLLLVYCVYVCVHTIYMLGGYERQGKGVAIGLSEPYEGR